MNVHASLFGLYQPQSGWLFRLEVGWKYLLTVTITVATLVVGTWWFTVVMLILVIVLLLCSRVRLGRILNIGLMMWIILAAIAIYQLVMLQPTLAVVVPGSILVAILAARIVTLTTSTPTMIDAVLKAVRVLRFVGINPNHFALALAIMMRSIPYLLGSLEDSRAAARARGREGSLFATLLPAMVSAVAYAQQTGEAIQARGLMEREVLSDKNECAGSQNR